MSFTGWRWKTAAPKRVHTQLLLRRSVQSLEQSATELERDHNLGSASVAEGEEWSGDAGAMSTSCALSVEY